jgi:hypothetical protein
MEEKTMKKLITLALVLVLALSLLTACGGNNNGGSSTTPPADNSTSAQTDGGGDSQANSIFSPSGFLLWNPTCHHNADLQERFKALLSPSPGRNSYT